MKNWTMDKLDRKARRLAEKTGSVTEARATLIALFGHPTKQMFESDEMQDCEMCGGSGDCAECADVLLEDPESCGECSGDLVCSDCGGTGEQPTY